VRAAVRSLQRADQARRPPDSARRRADSPGRRANPPGRPADESGQQNGGAGPAPVGSDRPGVAPCDPGGPVDPASAGERAVPAPAGAEPAPAFPVPAPNRARAAAATPGSTDWGTFRADQSGDGGAAPGRDRPRPGPEDLTEIARPGTVCSVPTAEADR